MNKRAAVLLFCAPFIVYLFLVFKYSVNAPLPTGDDTVIFFDFLMTETQEKWRALFVLHAEHRFAWPRLLAWLLSAANGGPLNFKHLIYIGNLGMVILVAMILYHGVKHNASWLYVAPLAYILLSPAQWTNMTWANTSRLALPERR